MSEIIQSSLLQGLNAEQLRAVTYPAESALILAGAGSGKTRVLTTRIAWLLQHRMADVNSVLAVTFTNKAAKEMRIRLSAMLPYSVRTMWLGTFHGLCHRFLRLHYQEANLLPSFQIIDSSDQLSLIKRLLKNANIPETLIAPRTLQGFINAQKEAGLRASKLQADSTLTQKMIECYAEYDAQCKRESLLDFAELLLCAYEILQNNQTLRLHYQQRFQHILVDEFQDTNKLQYAWLKLLSSEKTALFAVGDDDQSIYRFRGADVGNMRHVLADFHITQAIKLEQNYRSSGHILAAANAVITHNQERMGKNLRTEAEAGDKIRFIQAASDIAEASYIVTEVKNYLKQGIEAENIGILYRSNAQSRVLEQAFFQAAIPYKIYGGLRFYERQEVKHILAYLRLICHSDDNNAFLRIINMPPRGIGTRTIENIQEKAEKNHLSYFQASEEMSETSSKIKAFILLIKQMHQHLIHNDLGELVRQIIEMSGLPEYYRNQKTVQQDRLDNLDELIHAATLYNPNDSPIVFDETEHSLIQYTLLSFLATASLESGEHQAEQGVSAVQLMTVHAAKGLEFPVVFISGLEEGLFPSEYSLSEKGGLEEERRLMYVAITRARQYLHLSAAAQRMLHGRWNFPIPSRFVEEIPEELIHCLSEKSSKNHLDSTLNIINIDTNLTEQTEQFAGFSIGENVRHNKFGTGVIIDAVKKGNDARLTVNFGREGIKELDSRYAQLSKLNE